MGHYLKCCLLLCVMALAPGLAHGATPTTAQCTAINNEAIRLYGLAERCTVPSMTSQKASYMRQYTAKYNEYFDRGCGVRRSTASAGGSPRANASPVPAPITPVRPPAVATRTPAPKPAASPTAVARSQAPTASQSTVRTNPPAAGATVPPITASNATVGGNNPSTSVTPSGQNTVRTPASSTSSTTANSRTGNIEQSSSGNNSSPAITTTMGGSSHSGVNTGGSATNGPGSSQTGVDDNSIPDNQRSPETPTVARTNPPATGTTVPPTTAPPDAAAPPATADASPSASRSPTPTPRPSDARAEDHLRDSDDPCGIAGQYKTKESGCERAVRAVNEAGDGQAVNNTLAVGVGAIGSSVSQKVDSAESAMKAQETSMLAAGAASLLGAVMNWRKASQLKEAAKRAHEENKSFMSYDEAVTEFKETCLREGAVSATNPNPTDPEVCLAKKLEEREKLRSADVANGDDDTERLEIAADDRAIGEKIVREAGQGGTGRSYKYVNDLETGGAQSLEAANAAEAKAQEFKNQAMLGIGVGAASFLGAYNSRQQGQAMASAPLPNGGITPWQPYTGGQSIAPGGSPTSDSPGGAGVNDYAARTGDDSGGLGSANGSGSIGGGLVSSGGPFAPNNYTPAKAQGGSSGSGGLGGGGPSGGGPSGASNAPRKPLSSGVGSWVSSGGSSSSKGGSSPSGTNVGEDLSKLLGNLLGKPELPAADAVTGETGSRGLASVGGSGSVYPEDVNIFDQVKARYVELARGGRL